MSNIELVENNSIDVTRAEERKGGGERLQISGAQLLLGARFLLRVRFFLKIRFEKVSNVSKV